MKITPCDIKKLLRAWNIMRAIESGNNGKGVSKRLTSNRIKKIRNARTIDNLLNNIDVFREYVLSESNMLDYFEQSVIRENIISDVSVSMIADNLYTGTSSVYRVIDSFGDRLYKRMINDKYFEQTVNYLINRLQKYI